MDVIFFPAFQPLGDFKKLDTVCTLADQLTIRMLVRSTSSNMHMHSTKDSCSPVCAGMQVCILSLQYSKIQKVLGRVKISPSYLWLDMFE